MRKLLYASVLLVAFCSFTGTMAFADHHGDAQKNPSCGHCGMDRNQFEHTRMLIEYDDGKTTAECSLHCVAIDLAMNIDKTPNTIQVGDFKTRKLIDAESAVWVVGGNKPGVMSKRGKWAFEKKEDAENFVKENGGDIVSFQEAIKAAYEDMSSDTQMIREKRKMMKMKMQQTSGHKHE